MSLLNQVAPYFKQNDAKQTLKFEHNEYNNVGMALLNVPKFTHLFFSVFSSQLPDTVLLKPWCIYFPLLTSRVSLFSLSNKIHGNVPHPNLPFTPLYRKLEYFLSDVNASGFKDFHTCTRHMK